MDTELPDTDLKTVRDSALRLLARREHSEKELVDKLMARGFEIRIIAEIVSYLKEGNYLSDCRYGEMIMRRRVAQGYGPRKISSDLYAKGVDREVIQQLYRDEYVDWIEVAVSALRKKFAGQGGGRSELLRQQRYLQQRGFDFDVINAAIRSAGH